MFHAIFFECEIASSPPYNHRESVDFLFFQFSSPPTPQKHALLVAKFAQEDCFFGWAWIKSFCVTMASVEDLVAKLSVDYTGGFDFWERKWRGANAPMDMMHFCMIFAPHFENLLHRDHVDWLNYFIEIDIRQKIDVLASVREQIETYFTPEIYPNFVKSLVPVLLKILEGPCSFNSNSPEQVCGDMVGGLSSITNLEIETESTMSRCASQTA